MRSLTIPLILIGIFAVSGSVLANEVSMSKHTAEELKTVCEKSAESFRKTQAGMIAERTVMVVLAPTVSLAARLISHALPR